MAVTETWKPGILGGRGSECPGDAERPGTEPSVWDKAAQQWGGQRRQGALGIELGRHHRSRKGTVLVQCSLLEKGAVMCVCSHARIFLPPPRAASPTHTGSCHRMCPSQTLVLES